MEIIAIIFFLFIFIKFFRKIVVALFSFFRLYMFMAILGYILEAMNSWKLYSNIASVIGEPLTIIIFLDVGLSVVSFINWIPIGKPWITPRDFACCVKATILFLLSVSSSQHSRCPFCSMRKKIPTTVGWETSK